MGQCQHKTGPVSAGIYLQILGYADKTGIIIILILHRGFKAFQTIILNAWSGSQRCNIFSV